MFRLKSSHGSSITEGTLADGWLRRAGLALLAPIALAGLMGLSVEPIAAQVAGDEIRTAEEIPAELAGPDIRPEVGGLQGAVVSGHPLASQAGYEVLRAGGNAVDAAVTMAAMLTVLRPHMNSVGGDNFSLFYDAESGEVTALNTSGRAGELATPEFFTSQGHDRVPGSGALPVTVPGAVSGWAAALDRYGTISLSEALQPAIQVAEEGFMVTKTLAEDLVNSAARLNDAGQEIYRPGGQPLQAGDVLRSPQLAQSLRTIAEQGPSAMYGGEIGASIASFLEEEGGHLTLADFASHEPEWTESISVPFRGRQVHTVPPNSQGIVLLQMMGMAEHIPFEDRLPNSGELLHELVEIQKLTFADRDRWVSDPEWNDIPVAQMLDPDYLSDRVAMIGDRAAESRDAGFGDEVLAAGADTDEDGDTVYLMVVDSSGNAVSWIQSIFGSFGSNLVDPGTGIVLQNRGAGFTLEEGHPNQVAPGKRPFHTLMSALVTNENGFEMTIGTPGGSGQPQFLTQTLIQALVYGMSPQQAVEAPRFRAGSGTSLSLESRLPDYVIDDLRDRGHDVSVTEGWTANFGNMQVIHRLPTGVLRTGADMRREAAAMAY